MSNLYFVLIQNMTPRLMRNKNLLRVCALPTLKVRKSLIDCADHGFIFTCCDCCKNILAGNIYLQPKERQKLRRHKAAVREMGNTGRVSLKWSRVVLYSCFQPYCINHI